MADRKPYPHRGGDHTPGMYPPRDSAPLSRSISAVSLSRGSSAAAFGMPDSRRPFSPGLNREEVNIEIQRLNRYRLNVSDDDYEVRRQQLSKDSQFYATKTAKDVRPEQLLPYRTETIREQYRYLCHIVTHIYIAIKSLDLKSNISISVADLDKARGALLSGKSVEDFIAAQREEPQEDEDVEGERFETLMHTESEAEEDDEEEDEEDSWYESDLDSDEDEASMFASTPVSKVENRSASVISLKYWTKELKNLLTIGLVIPGTLSASLVKVYYAVVLSRGQSIDIGFYTDVIVALLREKEVLKEVGLRLDWRPIYDELSSEMVTPNESSHITDDLRFKRLVRFSLAVSSFFDADCIPHIMEKIMGRYSNQTISSSFVQMAVLLPLVFRKPVKVYPDGSADYDKRDIRYYLPVLFSCWGTQRSNKEIACLVSVIANIAERALVEGSRHPERVSMGKYGIFTREQFLVLINQLAVTTKVTLDEKQSKYVKLLVDIIVHSMTSRYEDADSGVLDLLRTFASSIRTLVHPSNSGSWSTILSRVVKRFTTAYHRRLLQERVDKSLVAKYSDDFSGLRTDCRLSESLTENYIDIFLPLIMFGVQSKSSSQRRRYITSLKTLCFVSPQKVLDTVLLDIYSSFDSVDSTHRINVILREVTALARYMVQLPVYRVHIPRLLSMLVPGIDSNDPEKTILTIGLVKLVSLVVPFADLTDGNGDGGTLAMDFTSQHISYLEAKFYAGSPKSKTFLMDAESEVPEKFAYDSQMELDALKSASSSFSEFIKQFCRGCFKYLEYSPNVESDEGMETRASVLIPQAFDALIESMSDELFKVATDEYFEYITNNVKHPVAIIFSNIAELLVRRDPHKQLPRLYKYLMPQIRREISEGAGVSRSQEVLTKDARIVWYLKLLCGTCLGAGKYLVPYLADLEQFLVQDTVNLRGEASYSISLLVNSIFASVSCVRPLERRLISPDWLETHGGKVTEACWGGFQFDPYRFDRSNLQFQWYRPSFKEVDPLVNTFDKVVNSSVEKIDQFLNDTDSQQKLPLETIDQITYHVNILDGSVAGICTLFDPSFKPHTLEPAKVLSRKSNTGQGSNISKTPSISAFPSTASLASMAAVDGSSSRVTSPTPGAQALASALSRIGDPNDGLLGDKSHNELPSSSDDIQSSKFEQTVINNDASMDAEAPQVDQYVVPDSEMPSGAATPSLMGTGGEFESIDASLTNRSSGLYTFGYYFEGNAFTKLSDPSYLKLHAAREKIGHILHKLALALIHRDSAIDLLSDVIQAISDWLKNCGYFSSNNPVFIDNIHLVSLLECAGVNNPYSRVVFGARAAVYHCNRMNLSRCTRLPTDTDKLLIKDLVVLSASSYAVTSYHASSVLTSALSKIMNCTYLVFGILKEWDSALVNKDQDKLKNVLRVFSLRKFRGLAEKNSHYLKRYEDLLVRSIEFDEYQITSLALKLYGSIKKYVRIPCKVCLMNFDLVEGIRPPDADIDRRIRALKLAKETKKKTYFTLVSRLMTRTLRRTSKHMYWKLRLKALEMVSSLQTHFEMPLNPEVLKVLAKSVNGIHPAISKKCVIWIASVLDVISTKGLYNYDLDKILCVQPPEPGVVPLSSIDNGKYFDMKTFFDEMRNFDHPRFFLDSKYWVPTLCWNQDMKVIDSSYSRKNMGYNNLDKRSIRRFGQFVTREWITDILKLHIEESESNTAFLPGMAYFIASLALLSIHGYTPKFEYEEFFDIVGAFYKKDEKATHLAASEVYTGLLLSCRIEPDKLAITDKNIAAQFGAIIKSDITQSTVNIWKIFCWWVPGHFDMRRCPRVVSAICNFDIESDGSVSPFSTFTRITLLKAYISSTLNTYHCFVGTVEQLFSALSHPYHIVAERVASILFDCLLYTSTKSFDNFSSFMRANIEAPSGEGIYPYKMDPTFDKCLNQYLEKISSLRHTVEGKRPQEVSTSDYMYTVRGLHYLVLYALKTSHGDLLFPYLKKHIIPLIFDLDNMKDACKLLNINTMVTMYLIASIRYSKSEMAEMTDLLCGDPLVKKPTLSQSLQLVSLTQAFYMIRYLVLSDEQRGRFADKCISLLYDEHLEVRERASAFFTLMVHTYIASDEDKFIHSSIKRFRKLIKAYRRKEKREKGVRPTAEEVCKLHGATLGLGSLIEAFPYTTPPPHWMPKVLSTLANKCSSIDGIVGRTAKDILSKFKKTRQDTWHIDSKFFTDEQLEDLEGVLWKSYFI